MAGRPISISSGLFLAFGSLDFLADQIGSKSWMMLLAVAAFVPLRQWQPGAGELVA